MVAFVVCLAITGCGSSTKVADGSLTSATKPAPANPEQALYDQIRSGTYQIGAAVDAIEEVRKTAREIASREKGDTQKALLTIEAHLNDAGEALSDFGDEPVTFEEFKKDFAAQDDKRLKAIDAGNESLNDLRDAQDILGDLLDSHPPEPENTELNNADSALDGCLQAVEDAIKAMGGKVVDPDTSDGK